MSTLQLVLLVFFVLILAVMLVGIHKKMVRIDKLSHEIRNLMILVSFEIKNQDLSKLTIERFHFVMQSHRKALPIYSEVRVMTKLVFIPLLLLVTWLQLPLILNSSSDLRLFESPFIALYVVVELAIAMPYVFFLVSTFRISSNIMRRLSDLTTKIKLDPDELYLAETETSKS